MRNKKTNPVRCPRCGNRATWTERSRVGFNLYVGNCHGCAYWWVRRSGEKRDYLAEARAILAGTTMMLPTLDHLRALDAKNKALTAEIHQAEGIK